MREAKEITEYVKQIESRLLISSEKSNEELVELIQNNIEPQKNTELLYAKNIRFIISIVMKYRNTNIELMDLIQESYFGLIKAIKKFSPSQGTKFLTFASWDIRAALQRFIQNNGSMIKLSAYMFEQVQKYNIYRNNYISENNNEPTDEQIVCHLGISKSQLLELQRYTTQMACVSIESEISNSEGINLIDMIASDLDVESDVIEDITDKDISNLLWNEIEKLEPQDAFLIKSIFMNKKNFVQVAPYLGIGYQQTSNRLKKLLKQLSCNETIQQLMLYCKTTSHETTEKIILYQKSKEKLNMVGEITPEMMRLDSMVKNMNTDIFKGIITFN